MNRLRLPFLAAAAALSTACGALEDALNRHTDVVARAAGHELSIEEAAQLLAGQSRVPNQPEVVEAVTGLWIDYTLLATAMADDSTGESVDLSPMVKTQVEQTLVYRLRDQVIQVDTLLTDEELQTIYQERLPGAQIRARHILLTYPANATEAQRDSVRALARDLRQRAIAGADFAELAKQYSQDPGSGPEGGDLGFFGRGEMVKPFDDAAFALEPGKISDLVESPFGIHLIRLEERRIPGFDEVRANFLEEVKTQRILSAESTYIAGIMAPANVQVADGAVEAARELARRPAIDLPRRAARRALTTYKGGAFTAREFVEFIQARPPRFRSQLLTAPDATVEEFLKELTRAELLVNEARGQGIELDAAERDSMLAEARRFLVNAAAGLGLRFVEPVEGETRQQAVQRKTLDMLAEMVRGEKDVVPLGTVAFALRRRYDVAFFDHNVPRVVERVTQLGGGQQPAATPGAQTPAPNAPRPTPQPAPADTTP